MCAWEWEWIAHWVLRWADFSALKEQFIIIMSSLTITLFDSVFLFCFSVICYPLFSLSFPLCLFPTKSPHYFSKYGKDWQWSISLQSCYLGPGTFEFASGNIYIFFIYVFVFIDISSSIQVIFFNPLVINWWRKPALEACPRIRLLDMYTVGMCSIFFPGFCLDHCAQSWYGPEWSAGLKTT